MKRQAGGVKAAKGRSVHRKRSNQFGGSVNGHSGLGIGLALVLAAGVFAVMLGVSVLLNQISGASTGEAATSDIDLAAFQPPVPDIATMAPSLKTLDIPATTPVLALVILDDGTESDAAITTLDWPVPVTLAVAADFDISPFRVQKIQRAGAEALALLPFDDGAVFGQFPNILRRGLPDAELRRRLLWHLSRTGEGIVGVIDHHAGEGRRDVAFLDTLAGVLRREGLAMIDSGAREDTLFAARMRYLGVRVGRNAGVVSRGDAPDAILDTLSAAERHAHAWGSAIVLIEAGTAPLAEVSAWIENRSHVVALAPVSTVLQRLRPVPVVQAAE